MHICRGGRRRGLRDRSRDNRLFRRLGHLVARTCRGIDGRVCRVVHRRRQDGRSPRQGRLDRGDCGEGRILLRKRRRGRGYGADLCDDDSGARAIARAVDERRTSRRSGGIGGGRARRQRSARSGRGQLDLGAGAGGNDLVFGGEERADGREPARRDLSLGQLLRDEHAAWRRARVQGRRRGERGGDLLHIRGERMRDGRRARRRSVAYPRRADA